MTKEKITQGLTRVRGFVRSDWEGLSDYPGKVAIELEKGRSAEEIVKEAWKYCWRFTRIINEADGYFIKGLRTDERFRLPWGFRPFSFAEHEHSVLSGNDHLLMLCKAGLYEPYSRRIVIMHIWKNGQRAWAQMFWNTLNEVDSDSTNKLIDRCLDEQAREERSGQILSVRGFTAFLPLETSVCQQRGFEPRILKNNEGEKLYLWHVSEWPRRKPDGMGVAIFHFPDCPVSLPSFSVFGSVEKPNPGLDGEVDNTLQFGRYFTIGDQDRRLSSLAREVCRRAFGNNFWDKKIIALARLSAPLGFWITVGGN